MRAANGAATLAGLDDKPLRCIGEVSACNRRRPSTDARGVEDAAPYGWVRNVGISIAINRCVNAANLILPPLGSPERGAVTALCAVTEGLVQRRCEADTS